jgi:adenylate kinase
MTSLRLLIMGPQGVGKGTQAERLSAHYGIPHISTGDIFRYNLKNGTALGKEAGRYINKGELVPDEVTDRIVEDRLHQDDAASGWILDGYPRDAEQVEALDQMLERMGQRLDAVVTLDAAQDVLLERMKKRAAIEGRADDNPTAIAARLKTYDTQTKPLLKKYHSRGLLVSVNGVGKIEDITATIIEKLDQLCSHN